MFRLCIGFYVENRRGEGEETGGFFFLVKATRINVAIVVTRNLLLDKYATFLS